MIYRQVCFSLLSSVFLFGSAPSLIAGNVASSSRADGKDSDRHSIPQLRITRKDKALFKIIEAAKNPVLKTNDQFDAVHAQDLLAAPLNVKMSYTKYLRLKGFKGITSNNPYLYIGILDNNIRVVIKEPIPVSESSGSLLERGYHLSQAIYELAASRVARDTFEAPTLPPTKLIYERNTQFQLRQYFIEDALSNQSPARIKIPEGSDMLGWGVEFTIDPSKLQEKLLREMASHPEKFGRPVFFKSDLDLFECFIGAAHRTPFDYLWVPCDSSSPSPSSSSSPGPSSSSSSSSPQRHDFFAIGYDQVNGGILEESPYFLSKKRIKQIKKNDGPVVLPPNSARLSFLQKLAVIRDRFPEYFEEGRRLLPDEYNSVYFQKVRTWQETLLGQYPMTGSAESTGFVRKIKTGK
ncbi:MAG: hypothetical protein K2W92_04380 [Alphaproteobacteria bacterium]|nr:hypothetical protein [Alphaproteobacteria bacterium]